MFRKLLERRERLIHLPRPGHALGVFDEVLFGLGHKAPVR
jgi:hypothetical protein